MNEPDALVRLRVPTALKARWVRANRDSGGAPNPSTYQEKSS